MTNKRIIVLPNQGFCYGVKRAINVIEKAIIDVSIQKPIYILGELAHNKEIQNIFDQSLVITINGSNRLEMLDNIPNNSTVAITAHGVSQKVIDKCHVKNLSIIDCTCPFVNKTYNIIKNELDNNKCIIFIGKPNHPETEAVLELGDNVLLYTDNLPSNIDKKIIIAHQTTLSDYDVEHFVNNVKNIYPTSNLLKMVCNVTQDRQKDLSNLDKYNLSNNTLIIVIGDKLSNNSTKLYELACRYKQYKSIMINSECELNDSFINTFDNIVICSGTSTPTSIIDNIIDHIKNL